MLWRCIGLKAHLSELLEGEISLIKAFALCLKQTNEKRLTLLLFRHSWANATEKLLCESFAYLCVRRIFHLNIFTLIRAFRMVSVPAPGSFSFWHQLLLFLGGGSCLVGWRAPCARSAELCASRSSLLLLKSCRSFASLQAPSRSRFRAPGCLNFPKPVLLLR